MTVSNAAIALVFATLAEAIAPKTLLPSEWAEQNIVVPDGPHAGSRYTFDEAPFWREPLDNMGTQSPTNEVAVKKSIQVGFTMCLQCWMGYIIDQAPAQTGLVYPTVQSVQDFNRDKLEPMIEVTPILERKVRRQGRRSAQASTRQRKRFPGGSILMTGANSAADLRAKTWKNVARDEIDQFPLDLDGQGDPMKMIDGRLVAHHATGDYKILDGSSPTNAGSSRINGRFETGDQRYWQVPCPHCGEEQRLEFGDKESDFGLKFNTVWPYDAHYVCRHNGCVIQHHEKRAIVQAGRWVPENPGPGRYPSYHVDTLISLFTTWDKIAEEFCSSKDDPAKLKTFVNLWLGQVWDERGDAPEWERLFARRENYAGRTIPPGGVILTGGADVQARSIYYEVVAWGFDRQSWSIDVGWLKGDTSDFSNPVWRKLDEVYNRHYPDAYGGQWSVDRFAVDSGFNANAVYEWCRVRPKAMAIKGAPGWHAAAISSVPSAVDINTRGKRKRRGARLWSVGTWPLKSQLYASLRTMGVSEGEDTDPPGFVHLTEQLHDDRYLKQLTAERIQRKERKGRQVSEWVADGPNHWHDCRIYAMAAAHHLRVGLMGEQEWAKWANARGVPPAAAQGDLLAVMNGAPAEAAAARAADQAPAARSKAKRSRSGGGGFFDDRSNDFF